MGRTRKPLSEQQGHLTKEQIENQSRLENAIGVTKDDIYTLPSVLLNARAKREYRRVVKLLDDINIIGDIDVNNLAMYCNAFAKYYDAAKQLEKEPLILDGGRENPLVNVQRKYGEDCRKLPRSVGLPSTAD